jgi:hypothetical protein
MKDQLKTVHGHVITSIPNASNIEIKIQELVTQLTGTA